MPASNEWMVPGRVLLTIIAGDLQLAEIQASNSEAQDWIGAQGVGPVHSIVELNSVERYPTSLKDIRSMVRADHPEKMGWVILVSDHTIVRFLTSTIAQLLRQKVRTFNRLDEACAFLWQDDPTLPAEARPVTTRLSGKA